MIEVLKIGSQQYKEFEKYVRSYCQYLEEGVCKLKPCRVDCPIFRKEAKSMGYIFGDKNMGEMDIRKLD